MVQQLMSELIRECSLLFVRERDAAAWPGSSPFPEEVCMEPTAQPHCSRPSAGLPLSPPLAAEPGSPSSPSGEPAPRRQSEPEPRPFDTPSPSSPVDPLYENFFLSHYQTPPPSTSTPPPPPPSPPVPTETEGSPGPSGVIGWPPRERRRASDMQESTLSVYDNMDAGGTARARGVRERTLEREDGTTSADSTSWSSCELLEEDPFPRGRLPSLRADLEDPRVNSPASSALTDAPLSSGSSEVFLPNAPADPPHAPLSNAMHCILTGLRQQMAKQKLEFESRIKR